MQKSKLIRLLRTLSSREFRKLGELAHSPMYNKNEKVRVLYAAIEQCYPDWESAGLLKESVFTKVFPGRKYDDKHLRAVMSDLAQLAEMLMIQIKLEADPFLKRHLLLQAADERGMDGLREEALNEMTARLPLDTAANEDIFHRKLETDKARYDHFLKTRNRSIGDALYQVIDGLDTYYLHQKLKYTCEAMNRSAILSEQYDMFLQEEILGQLAKGAFEKHALIRAYYQVFLTLSHVEEEEHYHKLKDLLAQQGAALPLTEAKVLYAYAQNYCIRKINTGRNNYLEELFVLYKRLLESGIVLEGQYIMQWDFKNIVSVGLRLNKITWTEQFINQYKVHLNPAQKDNAVQYNVASLHFYKKQYDKVARILQTVEFTDVFYNLDSRSLLLKTYYELSEFDALFQFSDTFSNYLRRNKQLAGYQKTVYLNLVKFITRLARVKLREGTISPKLKLEIETSREVADATWLRSKVEELV